jgi:two-component system, OmpR family, phosphate regulon sensor histidine kinase PhoR
MGDAWLILLFVSVSVASIAAAVAIQRGRALARLEAQTARQSADRPHSGAPAGLSLDASDLLELIEANGLGVLQVAAEGRIISANAAAHRMLERAPSTLVGGSLIGAFLDHRIEGLLERALATGTARLELASDGEPQRTLLIRAVRAGRRDGAWLMAHDVSELRRLRRIRSEFIDNLSHELRTPLTTVRVLAEVLTAEAERQPLPERVSDSIAKIDVETGHLVQMVSELLDLARIEQADSPPRRDQLDLGAVVEESLGRLRPYAERQGVTLQGEAPGPPAERMIEGDAERLGQLLINLLHNAIKFSEPGGQVVARLHAIDGALRLEVEDHGPGIPRRELERIFERFYKLDRARTRGRAGGGTGLGLAIARHIAEAHGGRIWAESEEGAGARFIVELPRR